MIISLIKAKQLRFVLALVCAVIIAMELASFYFSASFINYQFFLHLSLDSANGMIDLFGIHLFVLLLLGVIITCTTYFVSSSINTLFDNKKKHYLIVAAIGLASTMGLLLNTNFTRDCKSLFSVLWPTEKSSFEQVLSKYGLSEYTTAGNVEATAGKNIIIISLESIEKDFLEGEFKSLTPNLQKLKNKWNYIDIKQNYGSEWTSGSLYTALTGFPAFFGLDGNAIFKEVEHSQISAITHALNKANYKMCYLNGKASYSGTDKMLSAFAVDSTIDLTKVDATQYPLSPYGLRDKDLFDLAKEQITAHTQKGEKYAMILSTTDTHNPHGIYDERMEKYIGTEHRNLEFMVAAVDYMIGDFFKFLKENKLLKNAAVFIFPDHLKMGDSSMFKSQADRSLYLITNTALDDQYRKSKNNNYQIDLPKMILDGSEVKHNLKFLSDYIYGNKNEYLRSNTRMITEINVNGLKGTSDVALDLNNILSARNISKNYQEYKQDTMRYIAHAGGIINGHRYTNCKEAMDLSYKKGFRLFELDIRETKDQKFVAFHDWMSWAEMTGYKGEMPVNKKVFMEQKIYGKYTPMDMMAINRWFAKHPDAILVTDKVKKPYLFSKQFKFKDRLMMEVFNMAQLKTAIRVGVKYPMPSHFILNNMNDEKMNMLKDMGVENIAIGRRVIPYKLELLKKLKKQGFKLYAFLINHDHGYNEDYVVKYEMDYIYGIYADDWNF